MRALLDPRTAPDAERWLSLVGEQGPSTDHTKRQQQLAGLIDESESELSAADSAYFEPPCDLYRKLILFAAEHPEEFGGRAQH